MRTLCGSGLSTITTAALVALASPVAHAVQAPAGASPTRPAQTETVLTTVGRSTAGSFNAISYTSSHPTAASLSRYRAEDAAAPGMLTNTTARYIVDNPAASLVVDVAGSAATGFVAVAVLDEGNRQVSRYTATRAVSGRWTLRNDSGSAALPNSQEPLPSLCDVAVAAGAAAVTGGVAAGLEACAPTAATGPEIPIACGIVGGVIGAVVGAYLGPATVCSPTNVTGIVMDQTTCQNSGTQCDYSGTVAGSDLDTTVEACYGPIGVNANGTTNFEFCDQYNNVTSNGSGFFNVLDHGDYAHMGMFDFRTGVSVPFGDFQGVKYCSNGDVLSGCDHADVEGYPMRVAN